MSLSLRRHREEASPFQVVSVDLSASILPHNDLTVENIVSVTKCGTDGRTDVGRTTYGRSRWASGREGSSYQLDWLLLLLFIL